MAISTDTKAHIAVLLGREPRGLEEVIVKGEGGDPLVIRVASLIDDKPFPTMFWLVDPALCYRIDQLEAAGYIAKLQQQVDSDQDLQAGMKEDHLAHIALRRDYMPTAIDQRLRELGYADVLELKGIGGIADFGRIRCLHTWYGAHLVVANTIGRLLDDWWESQSTS